MNTGINLQELAGEALRTFPPLGNDRGAAGNYAQRMLTKHLAQKRKSGMIITDDDSQLLRATLDTEINALDLPSTSAVQVKTAKPREIKSENPTNEMLEAIISDCFHTTTDGSPEHLKYLQRKAIDNVRAYLSKTDAGWWEQHRFIKHAKQLIQSQLEEIGKEPSN